MSFRHQLLINTILKYNFASRHSKYKTSQANSAHIWSQDLKGDVITWGCAPSPYCVTASGRAGDHAIAYSNCYSNIQQPMYFTITHNTNHLAICILRIVNCATARTRGGNYDCWRFVKQLNITQDKSHFTPTDETGDVKDVRWEICREGGELIRAALLWNLHNFKLNS